MDFLDADKETQGWLVRECFNPILISGMKRIDVMKFAKRAACDSSVPYSDDMIKGAVFDTLDFFAAGEIGEDVVTDDVCKTLGIASAPTWLSDMVSTIRTHCLKEITALKIAKYSFDQFPRDILKETVANKIVEPYEPVE